jgi:hypothetical protein
MDWPAVKRKSSCPHPTALSAMFAVRRVGVASFECFVNNVGAPSPRQRSTFRPPVTAVNVACIEREATASPECQRANIGLQIALAQCANIPTILSNPCEET